MSKTPINDLSNLLNNVLNSSTKAFNDLTNSAINSINIYNKNNNPILENRGDTKSGIVYLNKPQQAPPIAMLSPESAESTKPNQNQTINGIIDMDTGAESNQELIFAGTPVGIKDGITEDSVNNKDEITQATGGEVSDTPDYEEFNGFADNYNSQVNQQNNTKSGLFLLDFNNILNGNILTNILKPLDRTPSPIDFSRIFSLLISGKIDEIIPLLFKYIDKPDDYENTVNNVDREFWSMEVVDTYTKQQLVEKQVKDTDVNVSSNTSNLNIGNNRAGVNTKKVIKANRNVGNTNGTSTDGKTWNFDDITSNEELESLFRSVNRDKINEISGATIHWSATFLNQDIDSNWLNDVHIQKGFDGIGYHIIIRRDGTLQRGRPLNLVGAHDRNNNENFLGFCFIGGINQFSSSAKKPYWKYASAQSLTLEQFKGYDNLMRAFHKVFPYAQVVGHYTTSNEGKVDPGFDVIQYSYDKFGHQNVISEEDPRWASPDPITLKDLG